MREYRQYRYKLPADASALLLIRHGESIAFRAAHPFALKDGQSDPPLHDDGIAQARTVAAHLAKAPLAAIYVTPFKRTHQSAAPLSEKLHLTPQEEPDLRELHLGEWEGGISRIKAAEGDPLYFKVFEDGDWGHIPGAETKAKFEARVARGLRKLGKAHRGQEVAVFTHGGVIAAALSLATGVPSVVFLGAENGSISRLVVGRDYFYLRSFNETGHLNAALR